MKALAQGQQWQIQNHNVTITPPTNIINPNIVPSNFPSNAMEDVNGGLQFSVNEASVSNFSTNTPQILIPYKDINNNYQPLRGTTEYLIVPVPGNCHKYYLIAGETTNYLASQTPDCHPFYIRLNTIPFQTENAAGNQSSMSTDLGGFYTNTSGHMATISFAVTPLRASTNDRLLFILNSEAIFVYTINAAGIFPTTSSQVIKLGTTPLGSFSSTLRSEMEVVQLANGDYRLAAPFLYANITPYGKYGVAVYDYSGASSSFTFKCIYNTNTLSTAEDRPTGLEFSPNGSYLYIATTLTPYLRCIDAATGSSQTVPTILQDFKYTQLEIAKDGSIYGAAANRLGKLTNPNTPATATWLDLTNDPILGSGTGSTFVSDPIALSYGIYSAGSPADRALRLLPDQIDGENYNNSFLLNTPSCCDDFSTFEINADYTAPIGTHIWTYGGTGGSNNPWNATTPVRVRKKITIPPGANVTITGMTFEFGLNGTVEIQKGATLTLLGTKFTNLPTCSSMWPGVTIIGTSGNNSLSQNGVLIMSVDAAFNPSIIENAIDGVSMPSGGQLLTYYAIFRNNWHSLNMGSNGFLSSQLQNTINQSTFESNAPLLSPHLGAVPNYFIYLNQIKNITFVGTNQFTNGTNGISSDDANYNLSQARFNNVSNGIWSRKINSSFSSQHIFTNNIFQDFFNAVRIDGGYNDLITDNVFNPASGAQATNYFGIKMESSGGFRILDNTFYRCQYAVYINNSGSLGGRVSTTNGNGNQFISCWRGVDTRGSNPLLQIKCNYFENHQSNYSTAWYIGGALADQGLNDPTDPQSPAGNRFFRTPATRIDITSVAGSGIGGLNFTYFHHSPTGFPEVRPTVNSTARVVRTNTFISFNQLQACLGVNFMLAANYNPNTAQQLIANETNPTMQQLYANELVAWYRENGQDTALISFLQSRNDDASKKVLINEFVKTNAYAEAQSILNQYAQLSDDESINYVALNSILLNWAQQSISPFDMTETEQQTIRTVSTSETRSAISAQNILSLVFDEPYSDLPSDTSSGRLIQDNLNPSSDLPYYLSPAYPNPSSSETVISFVLPENINEAAIEVADLYGRSVKTIRLNNDQNFITINTEQLLQGTYSYRLLLNKVTVCSNTFIVIK